MSVISRTGITPDHAPRDREQQPSTLAIAWTLPRRAAADILPDVAPAHRAGSVTLAITIKNDRVAAAVIDHANRTDLPIELPAARVRRLAADRWLHIDINDSQGRVLSASIETSTGREPTLRYAVTGLFTRLGIPGGRASRPSLVDPTEMCE